MTSLHIDNDSKLRLVNTINTINKISNVYIPNNSNNVLLITKKYDTVQLYLLEIIVTDCVSIIMSYINDIIEIKYNVLKDEYGGLIEFICSIECFMWNKWYDFNFVIKKIYNTFKLYIATKNNVLNMYGDYSIFTNNDKTYYGTNILLHIDTLINDEYTLRNVNYYMKYYSMKLQHKKRTGLISNIGTEDKDMTINMMIVLKLFIDTIFNYNSQTPSAK